MFSSKCFLIFCFIFSSLMIAPPESKGQVPEESAKHFAKYGRLPKKVDAQEACAPLQVAPRVFAVVSNEAEAVFIGTVKSIERHEQKWIYKLEVEKNWKGAPVDSSYFLVSKPGKESPRVLEEGRKYLVMAAGMPLVFGICSFSIDVTNETSVGLAGKIEKWSKWMGLKPISK